MPNKNKNKGNNGEREICKIFGEVFNQPFQRVPNSGGMRGGLNNKKTEELDERQRSLLENDIIPPECFPHCALEVKTRNDFSFHQLFREEGVLELNNWIDQVKESGIDMNTSFPMIVFKPNRKGWYLVLWGEKIKDYPLGKESFCFYKYNSEQFVILEMEPFLINNRDYLIRKFS